MFFYFCFYIACCSYSFYLISLLISYLLVLLLDDDCLWWDWLIDWSDDLLFFNIDGCGCGVCCIIDDISSLIDDLLLLLTTIDWFNELVIGCYRLTAPILDRLKLLLLLPTDSPIQHFLIFTLLVIGFCFNFNIYFYLLLFIHIIYITLIYK